MTLRHFASLALCAAFLVASVATAARAQSTDRSGIEGKVTDETGAVLPGVAVTVKSAALLGGARATVSMADGRYRFTALPGGRYTVTFELGGFSTVTHTDVVLDTGFVATIDGQMRVSTIQESVTVSGQSPVVDVKTTAVSTNLNKDALENLPTSRSMWQLLAIAPGLRVTGSPDVGGSAVGSQQSYQNYGTSNGGNAPTIDGVNTREVTGGAGFYYDYGAFQEVQIKAMGNDAEVSTPGTNFVGIIKTGGDTFRGSGFFAWETPRLQGSNVDEDLRAQGVGEGNPLKAYHDANVDLGGPIWRRRIWFYGSYRHQEIRQGVIGYVASLGADGVLGTSDDEPGEYRVLLKNYTGKVSGQLNPQHRFSAFTQYQVKDQPERTGDAFRTRESTWNQLFKPLAGKGEWTWVQSDRTLINAFVGRWKYDTDLLTNTEAPPRFDTVTLRFAGGSDSGPATNGRGRWQYNAAVTHFVPFGRMGTHDIKGGVEFTTEDRYSQRFSRTGAKDYVLRFQSGRPFEVVLSNAPFSSENLMATQSAFLRDVWQVTDRLTLNLGVRFDRYHVYLPEQEKPAGRFSQAGAFDRLEIRDWRDWAPRVGASWALDASKRTVVKLTYGWFSYVTEPGIGDTFNRNALITTTYRWNDLNGNLDYDDGEQGTFVTATGASSSVLNPDLGQPRTHEATASLERQIGNSFSTRVSYVFKKESDLFQSVNIARPASAFNIPITSQDPGPDGVLGTSDDGGSVTYYDFAASFAGAAFVRNQDTNTDDYANSYHNIEVAVQKRLSNRWQLVTSYLATRFDTWPNGIPQDPNAANFFPKAQYWDQSFKLSASYLLPFEINVAGTFTSQSGAVWAREARFTTGLRQQTQLILLMEPRDSRRLPRQDLLNLRVEKQQRLKHGRVSLQLDVFNVTNINAALAVTARSGASFGRITSIVNPRVARLGVTYSF
jgi:hypothetical protein